MTLRHGLSRPPSRPGPGCRRRIRLAHAGAGAASVAARRRGSPAGLQVGAAQRRRRGTLNLHSRAGKSGEARCLLGRYLPVDGGAMRSHARALPARAEIASVEQATAAGTHKSDCATAARPACRDRHVGMTCDFRIVPWSAAAGLQPAFLTAEPPPPFLPSQAGCDGRHAKFNRIVHPEVRESEI